MKRSGKGFTLIELMIVVAIVGILFDVLPMLFHFLSAARRQSRARAEQILSAQTVAVVLGRDIRSAGAVAPRFQDFTTSERCLILKAPAVAAGGRPLPAYEDHVVYSQDPEDPSRLLKQVFPSPRSRRHPTRQVLAAGLESLRFTLAPAGAGARLVSWELDFRARIGRSEARKSFASAAALRRWGF